MSQNFRIQNVGLINRDKNYLLNLMEKHILDMKVTL